MVELTAYDGAHKIAVNEKDVSSVHEPPRHGVGVVVIMRCGTRLEVQDSYGTVVQALGV